MKDSATRIIATVPIAKASGAAAPAACTTNVILNAAVTVGQMTDTDIPMASGRLKRLSKFAMHYLAAISPHHEGCCVRVRRQRPDGARAATGPWSGSRPYARRAFRSLRLRQSGNLLQQRGRRDLAAIAAIIAQRPFVPLRRLRGACIGGYRHEIS